MKYTTVQKLNLIRCYQNGESVSDICTKTGIPRSTFYSWLKPYRTQTTNKYIQAIRNETTSLKKHIEKLENIIKILKSVNCTASSPLQTKLKTLESIYGQFSVHTLCEALDVPRGTFYNHMLRNKKENKSYQFRRTELSEQIKAVYDESNQIYGARKIKEVLAMRGIITSERMVSELMQEMNLRSIRSGAKQNYIKFNKEKKLDKLKMNFSVSVPDNVWVGDITYFNMNGKIFYICAILDLFSRKAIAYKISQKQSSQLVTATFRLVYESRKPQGKLIFHNDRGTQYTSFSFQKMLKTLDVDQSFSPTGKPRHNAVMESFFSSLKQEELYRRRFHSVSEFKNSVNNYINFYNNERPHSTLNYKSPNVYEEQYFNKVRK